MYGIVEYSYVSDEPTVSPRKPNSSMEGLYYSVNGANLLKTCTQCSNSIKIKNKDHIIYIEV